MSRDLSRPLREAWIVEAVRTPVGRRGGGLSTMHPPDLLAVVLREVVDRVDSLRHLAAAALERTTAEEGPE